MLRFVTQLQILYKSHQFLTNQCVLGLITENSPGGYNLPKLALLSYSPFPPSLILLRKWSLRFIALLMYRFWPMKTFQASLTMGLLYLSREKNCEPAPPEGHLQCSLRLGTLCKVGKHSTIKL